MKKYRNKVTAGIVIAVVLLFVYWWGGDAPALKGWNPVPAVENTNIIEDENNTVESQIPAKEQDKTATEENKPQSPDNTPMTAEGKEDIAEKYAQGLPSGDENGNTQYSESSGIQNDTSIGTDMYRTGSIPEGRPVPIEPQNSVISDKMLTCTLSVRCDTIIDNIALLDSEKVELVPKDGVIFAEQTVTFYEGESVFNLLTREMRRNGIHLEFVNMPIYNSAYIEGINNLYEFDCGELSGWRYKVNGWFPNYGCSRYQLKEGDRVQWVYTCNMGADVGVYQ